MAAKKKPVEAVEGSEVSEPVPIDQRNRMGGILASDILKSLKKKFGAAIVEQASAAQSVISKRIPTGVFALDFALAGGWPVGRVCTVFGQKSSAKSTVLLKTIGQAQRLCANCYTPHVEYKCECGNFREVVSAYIDVEGAFDRPWAEANGVDCNRLLLSRPEYAEQGLDIAEALLRSNEVDVLVLDSIAFMSALKEIEGSASDENPGIQARILGKGMRKFVAALNQLSNSNSGRKPTIFLVNQIRNKIGVMFGCFSYDSRVLLSDGTTEKIGTIVNHRLPVEVISFDPITGKCEPRKVIDWHNNGPTAGFLEVEIDSEGTTSVLRVTPNHMIFCYNAAGELEERPAQDLHFGVPVAVVNRSRTSLVKGVVTGVYDKKVSTLDPTRDRYDLTVEGHHTYCVEGVGVHNSPETTSGGLAPGFAASVEVKFWPGKYKVEDELGGKPVSVEMNFRVEKNKTSVAKMEGTFALCLKPDNYRALADVLDEGFIVNLANQTGLLKRGPGGWDLLGEVFAKKEQVEQGLVENFDLYTRTKEALLRILVPV